MKRKNRKTENERSNDLTMVQKLQQDPNCLASLLSFLPEYIYWMDIDGRIVYCNEHHATNLGFASSEELAGKNIYDVANILGWDKSVAVKIRANDMLVMKTKRDLIKEEIAIVNGKKAIFLVHKKPLCNQKGKVVGIIGTSIDITERKKLEESVKNKQIEKLKLMETLVGMIAHEMRTPLTALNLNLDLMAGNINIDNLIEYKKRLQLLVTDGKFTIAKAQNLIDIFLLKLQKMITGIKPEDLNPCIMLDDVSDALKEYPFTSDERKLVSFDKQDAFIYLGDSLLTKHIIFNLLKNALKIIKEEEHGKIAISFKQTDKCNQLIFTDTSKGISAELIPVIFDAFITKDKTKKGTGLGLAFCKMVMQAYGGSIVCESIRNKYTTFILNFPKFALKN